MVLAFRSRGLLVGSIRLVTRMPPSPMERKEFQAGKSACRSVCPGQEGEWMNLWTAQLLFQFENYTADSQSSPVPAKVHSDRRQQSAARQTDRWSNRVEGQTPTTQRLSNLGN